MWDPGLRKTNATRAHVDDLLRTEQKVVAMVATSWYGHFGSACITFFAGPHYKACTSMRARIDQLCLDPGREMFDDHFILV